MNPVILTSAYLAPVQYFTKLYAAPLILEERYDHYVKQTYRNRCIIAGPNGPQALTIPVERNGAGKTATRDVRISDHGNWRHLHWNALVSSYENSPFFEYYADDFRPFYEQRYEFLVDFNEALRHTVCQLLDLQPDVRPTLEYANAEAAGLLDLREAIHPKADHAADAAFRPHPYYQVFARRTGFLSNLSIADLLFNMGPEARIVLKKSICEPTPATL